MATKNPIKMIPVSKLSKSALNVRKAAVDEMTDDELYLSIKTFGIKQNVLAHAVGNAFEVHAGGRRLEMAQRLVEEGEWEANKAIPCMVETREQALDSSYAENSGRADMHPADEFEAMKAMFDNGVNEDEIAVKFGKSTVVVRRRLKLANLAPEIFEAFRADKLSFEAAKEFCLSDDHAAQVHVFNELKASGYLYPHYIRDKLLNQSRSASSKLAVFVGLDTYREAGGSVTEDLFSDRNSTYLTDLALLEQLALKTLEKAAEEQRGAWKWAEPHLAADYDTFREYARVYPEPVDAPVELLEELEALTEREQALETEYDEGEWTEELQAEEEALIERKEQVEAEIKNCLAYSAEQKQIAGCIVTIDPKGNLKVETGLVRPEDIPQEPDVGEDGDEGEDMADAIVVTDLPESVKRKLAAQDGGEDETGQKLSMALTQELIATRNQAMKAYLAADFAASFDLMLYTMAKRTLGSFGYHETPLDAAVSETEVYGVKDVLKETVAAKMLEAIRADLAVDWLELKTPQDFEAMCALSFEQKQAIFAFCVARGLKAQLVGPKADPVIETIVPRLSIDLASMWRPNARNYWARVPKAHALKIGRELAGDVWAEDRSGARKADIAADLELLCSDEAESRGGYDAATAAKAIRWLPEGFVAVDDQAESVESDDAAASVPDFLVAAE